MNEKQLKIVRKVMNWYGWAIMEKVGLVWTPAQCKDVGEFEKIISWQGSTTQAVYKQCKLWVDHVRCCQPPCLLAPCAPCPPKKVQLSVGSCSLARHKSAVR